MIPTAKALQLFTLLRGLGVEELSKPELTGGWEHKLSLMEHGQLSREEFMREIAEMTEHIVKKAKEFDRDTIPGDYATLQNDSITSIAIDVRGLGRSLRPSHHLPNVTCDGKFSMFIVSLA